MEDKKNAMRLDDEKMEQVAGGWAECPTYQEVLSAKNDEGIDISGLANHYFKLFCRNNIGGGYNCYGCPVQGEWRLGR